MMRYTHLKALRPPAADSFSDSMHAEAAPFFKGQRQQEILCRRVHKERRWAGVYTVPPRGRDDDFWARVAIVSQSAAEATCRKFQRSGIISESR